MKRNITWRETQVQSDVRGEANYVCFQSVFNTCGFRRSDFCRNLVVIKERASFVPLLLLFLMQLPLLLPNNLTPRVSASCRAPSEPKMWVWWLQLGQWKTLMFCTRPRTYRNTATFSPLSKCLQTSSYFIILPVGCAGIRGTHPPLLKTCLEDIKAQSQLFTGTLTFLNISAPLRASSRAMSCGVDTITAPPQQNTHKHTMWL